VRVFLIHGMGRSRASMLLLGSRLKRAGHRCSTFGYYVSAGRLDAIKDRFAQHVTEVLARDGAQGDGAPVPYAIVGHSLGNIITRYASDDLPAGLCRFIMLAPPNRTPKLALALKRNPLYRALTGEAGQRLADPAFYEALKTPAVPTLVFAGDIGARGRLMPYGTPESDGVVGVEETRLPGEHVHRVVPAVHTFIMNDREVTRMICQFLEHGALPEA
jgi:pimeloyl-ACP methyl ester carboxylesterase